MRFDVGEFNLMEPSYLRDCVFCRRARVFIGRTPPCAAFLRFLLVEFMAFEIELFFLVIDRVNFMGESSPRVGLAAVPIGESLFPPDIPSGFKLF